MLFVRGACIVLTILAHNKEKMSANSFIQWIISQKIETSMRVSQEDSKKELPSIDDLSIAAEHPIALPGSFPEDWDSCGRYEQ